MSSGASYFYRGLIHLEPPLSCLYTEGDFVIRQAEIDINNGHKNLKNNFTKCSFSLSLLLDCGTLRVTLLSDHHKICHAAVPTTQLLENLISHPFLLSASLVVPQVTLPSSCTAACLWRRPCCSTWAVPWPPSSDSTSPCPSPRTRKQNSGYPQSRLGCSFMWA